MESRYYHRQTKDEYCGPASIQAVLNYLLAKAPSSATYKKYQTNLVTPIPSPASPWDWGRYDKWFCRPDEIQNVLQSLLKSGSAVISPTINDQYESETPDYYVSSLTEHLSNSKKPIVPIHGTFRYGSKLLPPSIYSTIVDQLILGDSDGEIDPAEYIGHWVTLTKYQNNSFIGFDPWLPQLYGAPALVNKHEPSTSDGDQCPCRVVYIHISGDSGAIALNFPDESRVAIVLESPETLSTIPLAKGPLPQAPPIRLQRQFKKCVNKAFDAKSLFDQMSAFGLLTQSPSNEYLDKVTIFSPTQSPRFNTGKSRLVRRLDAYCNDYYLVPLLKSTGRFYSGQSTVLARMDAPSGLYLDSLYYTENPLLLDETHLPAPPPPTAPFTQQDIIDEYVPCQLKRMKKSHWILPFQEQIQDTDNPPEMVWLPCKQSISPFFPFFVITAEAEKFLVRLDGAVFEKLSY